MTERELPKPPSGLRAGGRQAWDEICGEVELSKGELVVLRRLARAIDLVDKLEREVIKQSPIVEGYNGQPRPNPLLKVLQEQQLLIRRLVDSLNIPLPEEEVGLTAAQKHAQHAANVRWGRRDAS